MDEGTNQISAAADSDELLTTSTAADDYDENTEEIRAEIEDTRAEMTQTINEIQERLSPEHLVGQVKETVREATLGKVEKVVGRVGETISGMAEPAREVADLAGTKIKEVGTTMAETVRRTPIPVALIGLGVGMLLMQRFRGQSYGSSSSSRTFRGGRRSNYEMGNLGATGDVGTMTDMGAMGGAGQTRQSTGASTLNQVRGKASDLASRSTEAVSHLASRSSEAVSNLASRSTEVVSDFGTRFGNMMRQNPLAVGAVAVAAGTAVGLMLPSTQFESEYIGETGERLVERVEDVARDALDKVQDAAKQMAPEGQGQGQQPPA